MSSQEILASRSPTTGELHLQNGLRLVHKIILGLQLRHLELHHLKRGTLTLAGFTQLAVHLLQAFNMASLLVEYIAGMIQFASLQGYTRRASTKKKKKKKRQQQQQQQHVYLSVSTQSQKRTKKTRTEDNYIDRRHH
jgi:hypothetical protein